MATKRSFIANKVYVCVLGRVRLFATPWTVACQASLSMGFSRQGYWSGVPIPSPGNIPDPGIKSVCLMSPSLAGGFFTTRATWDTEIRVINFSYFQGYILYLDTVFYTSKKKKKHKQTKKDKKVQQDSFLPTTLQKNFSWSFSLGIYFLNKRDTLYIVRNTIYERSNLPN